MGSGVSELKELLSWVKANIVFYESIPLDGHMPYAAGFEDGNLNMLKVVRDKIKRTIARQEDVD